MPEFHYVQICKICQYGREANHGYYKKRGYYGKRSYSLNTETCVRRCIGKIAKRYLAIIVDHPELAYRRLDLVI